MNHPRPSEPAPSGAEGAKKGRGGRRPGAGAPRGNLNALKHGQRSKQFAQLGALIAASPRFRDTLLALAARHQAKQRRADELAAYILAQIIARGLKRGRDRLHPELAEGLIVLPPEPERRPIERHASAAPPAQSDASAQRENTGADNQPPDTATAGQSPAEYKRGLD